VSATGGGGRLWLDIEFLLDRLLKSIGVQGCQQGLEEVPIDAVSVAAGEAPAACHDDPLAGADAAANLVGGEVEGGLPSVMTMEEPPPGIGAALGEVSALGDEGGGRPIAEESNEFGGNGDDKRNAALGGEHGREAALTGRARGDVGCQVSIS
jgi:hypothetical protein